ncbi:hypothetical protein QQS21_010600 [Conoideocrella luteorostrata]|uniref:choline-phosphate cytidylyltransferase n=1 Tax=Conoideocrella luteorostrata TaxID=1105319 RepID=A0AAJ0CF10_9HYPO|nr:hypothetical protein QQS21_010600 [Conoideocrella luteorostrata]
MASPVLSQRTYRLSEIPGGTTIEEIRQIFPLHLRDTIQFQSLANALDSKAPEKQVSTMTFKMEPPLLASLPYDTGSLLCALIGDVDNKLSQIWIDAHFHGFTALNDAVNENEVVDIIALTGLGGKAFASWQCYDGSMWLRDHLPTDIPNSRVSIYGYSSDVGNSDSTSTLSEMTKSFVLDLLEYRKLGPNGHATKRNPLILMGHSTGGLIIKDAWCQTAESASPRLGDIQHFIFGLVFFGTPHNGMSVANILQGITGQPSENLVRDIEPGATYIKSLKDRFSRATAGLSIISCYELRQTPQSIFRPDGTLVRSGKSAMNAPEDSACLYWANEVRLPINKNHSMIAKLAKRDGSAYRMVVSSLSQLVAASRMAVPIRYKDQASQIRNLSNSFGAITSPEALESEKYSQSEDSAIGQGHSSGHAWTSPSVKKKSIMLTAPPRLEFNQPYADLKLRVYVHGAWDMFHYGHVRFLEFAKQAFPNTHLVVGVIGDEEMRKVKSPTVMSSAERAEVVRSCRHVDEVIENCSAILIPEFVAKLQIEYFGYNEESLFAATADPYKFLKLQVKAFAIPRTQTISSADIVSRIITNRGLFKREC